MGQHFKAGHTRSAELGSATLKCSGATATATCLKKQRRYRYSYNFSNIAALPLQTNVARYNVLKCIKMFN